jgi:hypothetical protein
MMLLGQFFPTLLTITVRRINIKIEAGKNQNPTLDTFKNIAKVLEIRVD